MQKIFGAVIISMLFVSVALGQKNENRDIKSINALVDRMLPRQAKNFKFGFLENASHEFEIKASGNKIEILGSDKSAITAGLGYYLRNVANMQITDCGNNLYAQKKWPLPEKKITKKTVSQVRNAYNYCTHCYTMASWNWEQWEKEIDRLALMGVNQALVIQGHEKVWQNFLKKLGCPDEEIAKFITSSAFTAWWLMANLEGHGGPISQNIIDKEAEIGRKMINRMKELGIDPIINGFFGMVPTFLPKYVKGHFIPQGTWCEVFVRPSVLSPTDPEFPRLAKIWYEESEKVFGKSKYYGGDLFHEGGNTGGLDLKKCASIVQEEMLKANPKSIYILQGWQNKPLEDFVQGFSIENALVQQLVYDMNNLKNGSGYRTYSDRNWTLNEVGNFGGNSGMYGNLQTQANLPEMLFKNPRHGKIIGLGLVAEGFINNPVVYEMWTELFWADKNIDLPVWLKKFVTQRYGSCTEKQLKAWQILEKTVYSAPRRQEAVTDFVISARPDLNKNRARRYCENEFFWNIGDIYSVAELLLSEPTTNKAGWRFDVVDVIRQLLNGYSFLVWQDVKNAYNSKNLPEFEKNVKKYLEIFDDLDEILATNEFRLLGKEIEQVRSKGKTEDDKKTLERNLRMLYSTWDGRSGTNLNDYASRSYAGLVKDYYKKRWEIYTNDLRSSLQGKGNGNYTGSAFEINWKNSDTKFNPKPTGDVVKIGRKILKKYGADVKRIASKKQNQEKFKWKLNPQGPSSQVLEFDVTNDIASAGKFVATVEWQSGNNALKIEKIQLFEGTKLVAEDVHAGYSGTRKDKNSYSLNLKKFRDDLTGYTLKATVHGDNGKDSSGILIFEEK